MKVAVIGAGIGGLSVGATLARQGVDVTIYERRHRYARTGLGLLLLPNGLGALDAMGLGEETRALSAPIDLVVLRQADGQSLSQHSVVGHRGIARLDLLNMLQACLPERAMRWGTPLQTLTTAPDGVEPTLGGRTIHVDLLVAADGARSRVRSIVAPEWHFVTSPLSELVSVCDTPDLAALYDRTFVKHIKGEARLAVGLVPVGSGRLVWFVQFDASMWPAVPESAEAKRRFVHDLVGTWAYPVPELIDRTDFDHTHLWRTPAAGPFVEPVHGRVLLVGDAAHPFPSLTSQGANTAMVDAVVLARHLDEARSIDAGLRAYRAERAPRIEEIRIAGARLVDSFVLGVDGVELPLVQ